MRNENVMALSMCNICAGAVNEHNALHNFGVRVKIDGYKWASSHTWPISRLYIISAHNNKTVRVFFWQGDSVYRFVCFIQRISSELQSETLLNNV